LNDQRQAARSEPRLRFVSSELTRTPGSGAEVRVTLSLRDTSGTESEFTGETEGVGADLLEPRLAVLATLDAIGQATGQPEYFRLVGIKIVPAFDTRVVLVCVRTVEEHPAQTVGAVPSGGDLARTAATATLDATNRLVARLLDRSGKS
jgi:hypothetical protein